jgi:hypothetical protein
VSVSYSNASTTGSCNLLRLVVSLVACDGSLVAVSLIKCLNNWLWSLDDDRMSCCAFGRDGSQLETLNSYVSGFYFNDIAAVFLDYRLMTPVYN